MGARARIGFRVVGAVAALASVALAAAACGTAVAGAGATTTTSAASPTRTPAPGQPWSSHPWSSCRREVGAALNYGSAATIPVTRLVGPVVVASVVSCHTATRDNADAVRT